MKLFYECYRESCAELDIAAMLMNRDEDYFFHKYAENPDYICLTTLEPYYAENPWSAALRGKKVLVISPFAETIEAQYDNRSKLFKNQNILPDFELVTLKAVQSLGDNTEGFETWFDALSHMEEAIKSFDFDIALIGCGAYSFPLAVFIKKQGKQAIVMGGALQILFGIKGKRWDNHQFISKLYNSHWVRPMEKEIPEGASKVENGCYW